MPVRSLNSSVFKWPDRAVVDAAARTWADACRDRIEGLLCLGYFGSCARGDWGVGSDLDLVAVVRQSDLPFERRGRDWDLEKFPVPAEILVYTEAEWKRMEAEAGRFMRTLRRETVWLIGQG